MPIIVNDLHNGVKIDLLPTNDAEELYCHLDAMLQGDLYSCLPIELKVTQISGA